MSMNPQILFEEENRHCHVIMLSAARSL